MHVRGTRVLITGAANGLGLAIATAFAKAGANIVATDINATALEHAVTALREHGTQVVSYALDVTQTDAVVAVRDRVLHEGGPIDILVNNAGIVFGGSFQDVALPKHLATVDVNLRGLLAVTHAFVPQLLARPRAHIVNIASASAVIALPFAASYAATKWAVLGFSDALREEFRELKFAKIGVSAICPSYIATGLFAGAKPARGTKWLTPETVATAVVNAVEREREMVLLPRSVRVLHTIAGLLPRRVFRFACRVFGVSRSMSCWQGHTSPQSR